MWRGVFIALMTVAAAAILGEAKRAGWKFSLKLLFLLVTLTAVVVGTIVWDIQNQVEHDRSQLPRD